MSPLRLSQSSLGMYLRCPRSYRYRHVEHVSKRTDYHRLLGATVHQFLAGLYRKHRDPSQPFFFSSLDTARKAWFYTWSKALSDSVGQIRFTDQKTADECGLTGWVCVQKYWTDNLAKPRPLQIERRHTYPVLTGVDFVGIFDQIRAAPIEGIGRFRPEILCGDALSSEYAPEFIVDLKTNRYGYNMSRFRPDASLEEQAAYQFGLHEDLQVTAYYWLYYETYHRLPVGFFWYHLRSGEWFFTYRKKSDFSTFFNQVQYVVDGLNAEQYPKIVTTSCRYCDFSDLCSSNQDERLVRVSQPSKGIEEGSFQQLRFDVGGLPQMVQGRLNLVTSRVKRVIGTEEEDRN